MRHFPLLLLLLLSTSLAAQAYQPFVQDNHRWMVSWDLDNTLWDFDDFYENVFGADTLINDTSYTMVWRNYYARTGEPGGFETIIQPFEPGFQDELIGFVREDTTLQRVYFRSEGAWISDQEFLIWIEDIGEVNYPFDPYYTLIPPLEGPEISLQCYYTDYEFTDQADYLAPDQSECYTYIVNNEEIIEKPAFLIHPNPAGNLIFWPEAFNNHHLLLYNSLGQNCGNYPMKTGNAEITRLQAGTYYYKVLDEKGIQTAMGKLIKL